MQLHSEIKKATSILEKARYKLGIAEFIHTFIDTWAYKQSGYFPPSKSFDDEMEKVAIELSHQLAETMRAFPGVDILGMFFCESQFYKLGSNFFPTPPEIGKLMAALCGTSPTQNDNIFYEPCSGTGSIAMQWMERQLEKGGPALLEKCDLVLEDISPIMCKAAMLQIVNMLCALKVRVNKVTIQAIDVLTRQPKGLVYILEYQPKSQIHENSDSLMETTDA